MRAAAALAKAAGDTASEMAFGAAAFRGTASLDTLQWVENSTWTSTPSTYCADGCIFGLGLDFTKTEADLDGFSRVSSALCRSIHAVCLLPVH